MSLSYGVGMLSSAVMNAELRYACIYMYILGFMFALSL